MAKSRPGISAWEIDRTIVRLSAVEVVDERFRALVVEHEVVERLWTARSRPSAPFWSLTMYDERSSSLRNALIPRLVIACFRQGEELSLRLNAPFTRVRISDDIGQAMISND